MFFRKTTINREPLPVAMSGVNTGERVLQIGIEEPRVAGAIAARAGLSGQATMVVADERAATRARSAAEQAGTLVDVHVVTWDRLPFPDGAFDAVIVHSTSGLLAAMPDSTRMAAFREWRRVVRAGGRVVVFERGTPVGLRALLRSTSPNPDYDAAGGAAAALEAAGFHPVRLLADREGYRFIEGIRPR
jgi:ubiquinone/menaquinone biosynthesis C-methylase UbiE